MSNEQMGEIIGTLDISGISGDIKIKSLVSKPSVYVVFEIDNKKQKTSEKFGKNPKWNEVIQFEVTESSVLNTSIYNGKNNEYIGGFELILKETIYIEQQNIKMKIYNEKQQEKGELQLLLVVHKKSVPNNNNYYSGSSHNNDYMVEDEEEKVLPPRKDSVLDSNNSFTYSSYINDSFAGQSEKSSLYNNAVSKNGLPMHKNNLSKLKIYNTRAASLTQSPSRSRSLSPMVYENGEIYRNTSSPFSKQPLQRSASKEHLYHFKSTESLGSGTKQNSSIPTPDIDNYVSSQPTYNGFINNSQSDTDEMEIYSSSLPTVTSYLSSSPSKLSNNNLYNNKIPYSLNNSIRSTSSSKYSKNSPTLVQSPLKTESSFERYNPKYNNNNNNNVNSPLKSDGASFYSNASGSVRSKSPSLMIKTSLNSSVNKNLNINSASSTPRSNISSPATPLSSSSSLASTPKVSNPSGRNTSYIPKPVQSNYHQSSMKSYVHMDRNGNSSSGGNKRNESYSEEISGMKEKLPSIESNTTMKKDYDSHQEEVMTRSGSANGSGNGRSRNNLITVTSQGNSKIKSSSLLYGPRSSSVNRTMRNSSKERREEEEAKRMDSNEEYVGSRGKNQYKVRSISNDSRLYRGHISITSNNTVTSLDDSYEALPKRESIDSSRINSYSFNSSSYSTEVLVIDSSNDASDQRSSRGANNSFIMDKILTPSIRGRTSLRHSTSVDSFIMERDQEHSFDRSREWDEEGERGRRLNRHQSPVPSNLNIPRGRSIQRYEEENEEEMYRRPAKARGRSRELKSPENPPRNYSLFDSQKNGRLKIPNKNEKETLENGEISPNTFSRNLSVGRSVSLRGKHIRSASQPASRYINSKN